MTLSDDFKNVPERYRQIAREAQTTVREALGSVSATEPVATHVIIQIIDRLAAGDRDPIIIAAKVTRSMCRRDLGKP